MFREAMMPLHKWDFTVKPSAKAAHKEQDGA
jgi:hypothetical protein